ncbi:MAG TPA: patatin-like phospholipase family protein [Candidatus Sulfotelmatobacter sp.]|nr:patatin-like phospholipase family protein [Candidatus Sulfotelmatobacter sp.]
MVWWLFKKKKIGLVLGGGVARGIAHIGVIKVLRSYEVPIDYIAGTSAGSLIAAVYASGVDVALLEEIALRIKWSDFFKLTLFRPGFMSPAAIEEFVVKYIGDLDFRDLKVPFAAVATDIRTGEKVVLNKGKVAKAVAASATFPGIFAPEAVGGKYLIDGGIASNVPVDLARQMGARYVIASDVIPEKSIKVLPSEAMQVLGRSLDLVLKKLQYAEARRADALIELEMEGEDIWHLDLHKARKLIAAGEIAAHRHINKIRKDLKLRSAR